MSNGNPQSQSRVQFHESRRPLWFENVHGSLSKIEQARSRQFNEVRLPRWQDMLTTKFMSHNRNGASMIAELRK
jgi:hypothetical protein